MKRISILSSLFAIGVSMTLIGGCGNKTGTAGTGSSFTEAELEAGRAKEIERIKNDKSIPEASKPVIIENIRAQK